jgi:cell division protease FtsH
MIIEQGMGTKLRDQVFHEDNGGMVFDRITHERPYSDDTAKEIDSEVKALMQEAANRAEIVLRGNMEHLHELAKALLKEETLEEGAVQHVLKGVRLPKDAMLHAA